MKNLYKVLFSHASPKDMKDGIETYIIAENDEDVYSIIDERYNYNSWSDMEGVYDIYDDDYNVIGSETFKQKIIRLKGEMYDGDYDFADAYYGITLYGWELVKEGIGDSGDILIKLGVVTV